jgi:hypothetical protein
MGDIDQEFEKIDFASKTEKSIKDFTNWLLGISIGICGFIISVIDNQPTTISNYLKGLSILILTINLANVLLVGITKYKIVMREIQMMIEYGSLKKISVLHKDYQTDKADWEKHFENWTNEYNKIILIGKLLSASIKTTLSTVIISGASIILLVILND